MLGQTMLGIVVHELAKSGWIFGANDIQKAAEMFSNVFTADIVYHDIPTDSTNPVAEGRAELLAFAQTFFEDFPISRFELGQSACRGQQGFFEWTWSGKDGRVDPPAPGFCGTGKPFTVRGVAVIAVQGNKMSRVADFWDLATVLRQLLPEGQECVAGLLGLSK
jgi:hypothetical protein